MNTRLGSGRPLLFLGSGMSFEATSSDAVERLSRDFSVIAPIHPGFGGSERPAWFTTVDDLAYFYLDLLQELDLNGVTLVGVSFGAWIATALATKSTERLARLVLANPLGIKVSGRETRDIGDIFAMTDEDLRGALFHDPAGARMTFEAMPAALDAARSREALARYGWSPYMHDPKLRGRLHRVSVPTLVLRGEADGLTGPDYTSVFASEIPGAVLRPLAAAGPLPHIEAPDAFADAIRNFANATSDSQARGSDFKEKVTS